MGKPLLDKTPSSAPKVRDFTDLVAWESARALRASIYKIFKRFPHHENFELGSQLRRAAVSITANLAEGYGRFSFQENIQFCRQSRGSLYELRDHLTTALHAGYITSEEFNEHNLQALSVLKLINGYIRATKQRKLQAEAQN